MTLYFRYVSVTMNWYNVHEKVISDHNKGKDAAPEELIPHTASGARVSLLTLM